MSENVSPDAGQPASPDSPGGKPTPSASSEDVRDRYGLILAVAAFVLLGVVFGVAMSQFTKASDVAAVVGSAGAIIGTIVGAFFGVHAASAGRAAAEAGRAKAEHNTHLALAKLDPSVAEGLLKDLA